MAELLVLVAHSQSSSEEMLEVATDPNQQLTTGVYDAMEQQQES
jgi:hypothetical protein